MMQEEAWRMHQQQQYQQQQWEDYEQRIGRVESYSRGESYAQQRYGRGSMDRRASLGEWGGMGGESEFSHVLFSFFFGLRSLPLFRLNG